MRAYLDVEIQLFGVMVHRKLRGRQFEREGKVSEAIELYEANIADEYRGSHPCERLRIIYIRQKELEKAIRACKAYLELKQADAKKAIRFQHHLEKLEARLQKQRGKKQQT